MDVDGAVIVRAAQVDDLGRIRSLHGQLYPELGVTGERIAAAWAVIAATPGRSIHVAEVGGVVVGTMDATVLANIAHRGEPYLLVEDVVVDRLHRRHGRLRLLRGGRMGAHRSHLRALPRQVSSRGPWHEPAEDGSADEPATTRQPGVRGEAPS